MNRPPTGHRTMRDRMSAVRTKPAPVNVDIIHYNDSRDAKDADPAAAETPDVEETLRETLLERCQACGARHSSTP